MVEEEEEADGMVPSLFGDDRVTSVACNLLFDFIVIFILYALHALHFKSSSSLSSATSTTTTTTLSSSQCTFLPLLFLRL